MLDNIKSLMQSGKLTEELASEIRSIRRDLDGLSLNLRRDIAAAQGDIAELRKQFALLTAEHAGQVGALGATHKDLLKLHADFGKALSDFTLAKSRLEEKFSQSVQGEMKKYINDMKLNLSGFESITKETPQLIKTLQEAKKEIDKFNAIAKKLQEGDFDLFKFSKELEKGNTEKLQLMKKIDYLERLVAKERRRKSFT